MDALRFSQFSFSSGEYLGSSSTQKPFLSRITLRHDCSGTFTGSPASGSNVLVRRLDFDKLVSMVLPRVGWGWHR